MSTKGDPGHLPWEAAEEGHYRRHVVHHQSRMREPKDRRKSDSDMRGRPTTFLANRHKEAGESSVVVSETMMRVKPGAGQPHGGRQHADIGPYSVPKSHNYTASSTLWANDKLSLPRLSNEQAMLASMYGDLSNNRTHGMLHVTPNIETVVGNHVASEKGRLGTAKTEHNYLMNKLQRKSFDLHWRPKTVEDSKVGEVINKKAFDVQAPLTKGESDISKLAAASPWNNPTPPGQPYSDRRRSRPSTQCGETEGSAVKSLKEIGYALNVKPVEGSKSFGSLPKMRNSPVPPAEHEAAHAAPHAAANVIHPDNLACKNVFEMWMELHRTVEDLDGRRKAAWLDQQYVPYHGTRHGQLTYGKDHVLIEEAFMMKHAVQGTIPDPKHIDKHLHLFDQSFKSIYSKCEGYVPWQMLQSCGFMFHHVLLVAKLASEAYGKSVTETTKLQHFLDEKELTIQTKDRQMEELHIRHAAELEELKQQHRVTNNKVTELQDTIKSYEAVRTAINLECASADPSVKLERLQKVFMGLKGDHEKLQEQEAELRKQFNTAKEDIDGLHADLGRQDNVMQLMEDVLPANSIKVKDSMCDVLKYLTPEQEHVLVHAISLGNDPEELYCLMMGVNLRGQDISPYKAVIGEMRTIFHKVTVAVRKDDAHVDESGQMCKISDRPLTKSYLSSLLKTNNVKELKARLGPDMVTRLSIAYNHGIAPGDLVNLLDGRMSSRGACMITNRSLFGILRDHDKFNLSGTLAQEIKEAASLGSLTAMLELRGKNKDLQSRLEKSERLVRQLESEVRVRDYKFGKVIGIDGNGGADDNDDFRSIADSWTLSSITKLDEFLARDTEGDFETLGEGTDVPKFLRGTGMIKNEVFGKKMTEDMISDIWASKDAYDKLNSRHVVSLQEYIVVYLQKHGERAVNVAYNLLHSCHKYKYDPDCEVFLQVLDNRVSQDIYSEFNNMMDALLGFLQMLDIDTNPGGVRGVLSEKAIKAMLQSFFADKKNSSLADLCYALRTDVGKLALDSDEIDYMQLFKEDENANQGEFATLLKRQHLQERLEFLHQLQSGLLQVSKEERITELSSRHVETVLKTMGIKMSRSMIDRFLELGLGSSWKSGVAESVMGIMKGIQRGKSAIQKRKYSNAEVCSIMNDVRESLKLERQEERQYLAKIRGFATKSYELAGYNTKKMAADKDGDHMDKLMLRSLRNVTYAMEKAASDLEAPGSGDYSVIERAESVSSGPISSSIGRMVTSQKSLLASQSEGGIQSSTSTSSKDLLSMIMQRTSAGKKLTK